MFQEILAPSAAFILFIVLIVGYIVAKKGFKAPRIVNSLIAVAAIFSLMLALGGWAESVSYAGDDGITDEERQRAKDAIYDFDVNVDSTAGNWEDTIVADVDLWAATGNGTCDDALMKCTMNVEFVYSTGGVTDPLFPNEMLIDVVAKNGNLAEPEGVTSCDNGCWPLIASFGSMSYIHNETDGNTLAIIDRSTDYEYHMYFDDKDDNPTRVDENQEINIGNFRPGESDTWRIGIKLEPYAFGAGGLTLYDSWSLFVYAGGQTIEIELLLTIYG